MNKNKVDVYIFHSIDEVVMGLFRGDVMMDYRSISKREIGEKWVEGFRSIMNSCSVGLKDIGSIYLNNSFSTWNASRLITLFVKTIVFFEDVELYLREESQDKLDVLSSLKSFCKHRKNFRKVESELDVAPIYKKCPNINI